MVAAIIGICTPYNYNNDTYAIQRETEHELETGWSHEDIHIFGDVLRELYSVVRLPSCGK